MRAPGYQGRSHDHAALGGTDDQAFLESGGSAAPGDAAFIGEAFAAAFVLGKLQGGDQASALDIADQRVIAEYFTQALQLAAAWLKRAPLTKPAQLFVEFCKAQLGTGNGAEVG